MIEVDKDVKTVTFICLLYECADFFLKGKMVNILVFVAQIASVVTTQLCCSTKAAIDNV